MTDRPRLYPGHQHQWADAPAQRFPDELDQISWGRDPSNLVVCTVCGFQAPRNVAGLDGRFAGRQIVAMDELVPDDEPEQENP